MKRKYLKDKDRQDGKLYNKNQFGYWEFTPEQYKEREEAEAKHIVESEKQNILSQIFELENSVTERRKREAFKSEEGKNWIINVDTEIEKLRAELQKINENEG